MSDIFKKGDIVRYESKSGQFNGIWRVRNPSLSGYDDSMLLTLIQGDARKDTATLRKACCTLLQRSG